ncbi:MAG: ATP-binding protein [Actinomycetota bacterium]|nr:ATP-binding protein [Actinomycetota bacterium]
MERSTTLEADPVSVSAARRFVVEALVASGRPGDADTVELLVSELVTNAVLHARSRTELVVQVEGETLRVEVRDTSCNVPTVRAHGRESETGRGLELVELLSDRWGAELDEGPEAGGDGKSVWFELALDEPISAFPDDEPDAGREVAPGRHGSPSRVCLEGVPLALLRASREHQDGLTREFVLMTLEDADVSAVPARLVELSEDMAGRFAGETAFLDAQVDEAEQRGDASVDLSMELAPEASDVIAEVVLLLEEADRYCAEGALLTLAASEEVRTFRRWWSTEIAAQLRGGAPKRWPDR